MELTEKMIDQPKADLLKAKTYDDLMGKDGAINNLISKATEQIIFKIDLSNYDIKYFHLHELFYSFLLLRGKVIQT